MRRDEALAIIRAHEPELRELGVATLELFGSVARDEAGPQSDVDLMVQFDRSVDLFHFIGLKLKLEEWLGCEVDLVSRRAVKRQLRERIFAEAIRAA